MGHNASAYRNKIARQFFNTSGRHRTLVTQRIPHHMHLSPQLKLLALLGLRSKRPKLSQPNNKSVIRGHHPDLKKGEVSATAREITIFNELILFVFNPVWTLMLPTVLKPWHIPTIPTSATRMPSFIYFALDVFQARFFHTATSSGRWEFWMWRWVW